MPSDSNGSVHSPIADLPLSDPQCINESCTAFAAAANLSQELVPWAGQFEYGHWTTWYYVVIIFILMVAHGFNIFQDRRSREGTAESAASFHQKVLAFGRYISYRRITSQPFDKLGLPSCGMLIFLLTTLLFLSILVFAVRPYYRYTLDFGSPPIAIRTGLMAFACMPILVALSGKANLVTLLTGISHEKLNVVHRWVAWMSFGLSIAHTIPFFVASDQAGGSAKVRKEFYANAMRGSNEVSLKFPSRDKYEKAKMPSVNSTAVPRPSPSSLACAFSRCLPFAAASMKASISSTFSLPSPTSASYSGTRTINSTPGCTSGWQSHSG